MQKLKNNDSSTALHFLIRNKADESQIKTLNLFLECGGQIDAVNKNGDTALHQAAIRKNLSTVKYLITKNASLSIQNSEGETCLHCALYQSGGDPVPLVKFLLDSGADPNKKAKKGKPSALVNNNKELEQLLKTAETLPKKVKK